MIRPLLAVAAAALVVAAPASAQAPQPPAAVIAAGVTSGGVALQGLTAEQATALLDQQLKRVLSQKVVVQVADRTFTFKPSSADFELNSAATVTQALAAPAGTAVVPVVKYTKSTVTQFVTTTAAAVRVAPRDARVSIGLKRIKRYKAKTGLRISNANVIAAVSRAMEDPAAPRVIAPKQLPALPKVSDADLKKQYRTVITVSKREFKLRLFKNFKVSKTYQVATGQPAYPTPSGSFHIRDKAINPTWSVPNSPWAGELKGTKVDGGSAENPLKARWMGIGDGVGFHGTGEDYSIGTRASHGCLRMHVKDVIDLYPRVPIGTPVLIR